MKTIPHKRDRRAYFANYCKTHPEKRSASVRRFFNKKRRNVLDYLGGKCIKCGFNDWRALQIDHINGCGQINRPDRYALLKDVKIHREKYQLLCANCNWIKKYVNKEDRFLFIRKE